MYRGWKLLSLLLVTFALALATGSAFAGTVGKLNGVVKDARTGLPLPNANVTILGTAIGASAGAQGDYFVLNVPAGTYDIKASIVGYKEVVQRGVRIIPDFTTEVAFNLEPTVAAELEEITIGAEKPLIQRDRTGTTRFLGQEDLQNTPVRGYQEAASLQAGVVSVGPALTAAGAQIEESTNDPRLYIRGGRSNEVAYYLDGFSQQDPLTGISTTSVNQNAIDQVVVMTGGFDAEYGRIMSGVVNVITREGRNEYFGSAEVVTDALAGDWVGAKVHDDNLYSASLGGPLLPGNTAVNFLVSGERTWSRDRSPKPIDNLDLTAEQIEYATSPGTNRGLPEDRAAALYDDGVLPNNWLSGWSGQGKVSWQVNQDMKVKVGGVSSVTNWQEYRHAYLFDVRHTPRYEDTNQSLYGTWSHTISPKTFYELAASSFYTERYRGDGIHFKDIEAYARPNGNPDFDPSNPLFNFGDSLGGDGGTVWDDFLHRESSYVGLRGDVTSSWREAHTAKAGVEFRRHTLRRFQHFFPVNIFRSGADGYVDVDAYGYSVPGDEHFADLDREAKHPTDLGFYLQDKYEKDDFVLRTGIRFDYLDPNTEQVVNPNKPFGVDNTTLDPEDLKASSTWSKVSPRIGVGFPVSEKSLFHANYGKFFQQPNLEDLYVSYKFLQHKVQTGGYFVPFGNPSLEPEETTAYEFGISRQVGPGATIDASLFYKDVQNLVQVQSVRSSPNGYSSFENTDFATIKGFDLSFDMRRTNHIQTSVYYTLSFAKGTGSASQTARNAAWQSTETPKLTSPLDFDQRHKLTLNVDWRTAKGEGPMLGAKTPFEKMGVNVLVNIASGLPFTAARSHDEVTLGAITPSLAGSLNDRNGPWTLRVDLKADRGFEIGRYKMAGYVVVQNVFDKLNPTTVYQATGDALSTGWLADPVGEASYPSEEGQILYQLKQRNPNRFDVPRIVRFGLRTNF